MPSFISGLTHAAAQGAVGYGEGDLEARRALLAQAAAARKEQRENIATLGEAAERGLNVAPAPTSGPPTSTTPAATPVGPTTEAGSSGNLTAPSDKTPSRIGSIGGTDVSIPAGGVVSKPIRDSNERAQARFQRLSTFNESLPEGHPMKKSTSDLQMIANDDDLTNTYVGLATGMKKPAGVPKEARVAQLRQQHPDWPLEKAAKVARLEYGETAADPVATLTEEVRLGLRKPTGAGDPDKKSKAIRALAVTYMKPRRGIGGLEIPGMDQESAFKKAEGVYNRSQGIVEGTPLPDDETPVTTPATTTTAGAPRPKNKTGGPPGDIDLKPKLSPADAAQAASDPGFAAWLKTKGKI